MEKGAKGQWKGLKKKAVANAEAERKKGVCGS